MLLRTRVRPRLTYLGDDMDDTTWRMVEYLDYASDETESEQEYSLSRVKYWPSSDNVKVFDPTEVKSVQYIKDLDFETDSFGRTRSFDRSFARGDRFCHADSSMKESCSSSQTYFPLKRINDLLVYHDFPPVQRDSNLANTLLWVLEQFHLISEKWNKEYSYDESQKENNGGYLNTIYRCM